VEVPGQGAADYEDLRGLKIDNLESEIENEEETRLLRHASPQPRHWQPALRKCTAPCTLLYTWTGGDAR
jgi:hypothetical protein